MSCPLLAERCDGLELLCKGCLDWAHNTQPLSTCILFRTPCAIASAVLKASVLLHVNSNLCSTKRNKPFKIELLFSVVRLSKINVDNSYTTLMQQECIRANYQHLNGILLYTTQ